MALYTSYGADTAFPNNLYPNARGMLTGTRTSSLNSPTSYKYTSFYYGERERLVQCHSQNDLGGYNDEYYTYNFTGTVATKKLIHSATGKATQTELYTNTYDSADRLTNVTHKLNNNSPVTLTVNTYDAVGRLQTKKPMNVETITYSYNVRSWLTGINSTLFSEDIAYNQAENGLAPTNLYYNGNVGAIRWKTGNETNTRGYQFTYNALDWLTNAAYVNNGNSSLHYKTNYWYDKMGNITALERRGLQDDNSYDYIDDLAFTYNGNQVTRVDDYEEDPTYTGAFNFVDGSSTSNEYQYDGNGNMTKNLNRNISSIQYNLLNLPRQITYQNGNGATYTYDAMGKKLSVVYNVGSSGYTYYYSGNCIYRNGTLEKILVDGGYITLSGTTPTYHYYLQDHLGNNRVVCNASGTIKQVNHYYPFGGLFGESTGGSTQVYKYNGKEFDRINGLDLYDYGARHMSPDIGRFTTMDPMAEKYYNTSPYAYCANNPINNIDPNGMDWNLTFSNDENGYKHYHLKITGVIYNSSSNNSLNMNVLKDKIQEQISDVFSFSKGLFDVTTTVDLKVVSSIDDIKESDHVFKVVDQNTLNKNELAKSDMGGLQIRLGTSLVEKILSGENSRTVPHEVGHTGGWDHTTNMDNIMSQSLSGNQNSGKSISVPQFKTLERNYNNGILNTKTAIYKIPQLVLLRYSKYNIPGLYIKWSKRLNK